MAAMPLSSLFQGKPKSIEQEHLKGFRRFQGTIYFCPNPEAPWPWAPFVVEVDASNCGIGDPTILAALRNTRQAFSMCIFLSEANTSQ